MGRIFKVCIWSGLFPVLVFSLGLSFSARADMGRVYVSNDPVTVSEDSQKAIILHNLSEEVLVLGTDLKASKKTGIIRFIPFPSEPAVSLAPAGSFEKAAAMIKKYGLKYQHYFYTKGGPSAPKTEGVELRLNKKLGAHDMTVIKVNDVSTFRQWVNKYFKSKGLPAKEKYPEEEAVVDDYVKRGLVYFVLDYVEDRKRNALYRAGCVPVQEQRAVLSAEDIEHLRRAGQHRADHHRARHPVLSRQRAARPVQRRALQGRAPGSADGPTARGRCA